MFVYGRDLSETLVEASAMNAVQQLFIHISKSDIEYMRSTFDQYLFCPSNLNGMSFVMVIGRDEPEEVWRFVLERIRDAFVQQFHERLKDDKSLSRVDQFAPFKKTLKKILKKVIVK